MIDDLDALYKQGYEVGLTGIRSRCPDELYDQPDHTRRDAWIDGYKEGMHEYRRQRFGYDLGSIYDAGDVRGKLWIDEKDPNGFIAIRDCEGGTVLAKVQVDPEPRVLIPKHNVTPEMGHVIGRAIMKAASMAFRIQQDRALRLKDYSKMKVPSRDRRGKSDRRG